MSSILSRPLTGNSLLALQGTAINIRTAKSDFLQLLKIFLIISIIYLSYLLRKATDIWGLFEFS